MIAMLESVAEHLSRRYLPTPDKFVVESQELWAGTKAAPANVLLLGQLAGAFLGLGYSAFLMRPENIFFPTPKEWKKGVPKDVCHARAFQSRSVKYTKSSDKIMPERKWLESVPGATEILPQDLNHSLDAWLLAEWVKDTVTSSNL